MKRFITTFSAIVFCTLFTSAIAFGHSTSIVISQVYGGGGSAAASTSFKKDFVELKNVSSTTQSLNGLSLTYASAAGQFGSSATNFVALNNITLNPGQYYLILLGGPGTGGADITGFDQTTTNLTMSGTSGKVALVTSAFVQNTCGATATPCALSSTSPSAVGIVDSVSYGTANNAEGGTAVAILSTTTSAVRASGGCVDTDKNNVDFTATPATVPNFTGSALSPCNTLDITTANSMPNGNLGVPYTNSFASTGGSGTYTYAVTTGTVPTGLTLNSNGTWSGTPTSAGLFTFSVQVTDTTAIAPTNNNVFGIKSIEFAPDNANTTTEAFTLRINAAPTAASVTVRGRVVSESGRGLSRAAISLFDTQTGETRYARANQMGYFTITDLPVGDFYIMQVQRKGYDFPALNSFQLFEDLEGLTVIGTINQ
jgi:Lamin Tail Domain/Carboxypeptidase regulatory-like domain/Putative Ig domain